MKKPMLKFVFLLFLPFFVFSQKNKKCASRIVNGTNSKKSFLRIENLNDIVAIDENTVIQIPIVVHVIHNTSSNLIGGIENGNISDQQILSQIEVLNQDYRRKAGTLGYNSSAVGADMKFEFNLANVDPYGNPTSGINRVYSSKACFDVHNDQEVLSKLSYWDSSKYLNVWVTCLNNDYLGYGEFPGGYLPGLERDNVAAEIDGIIVDFHAFGSQTGTATNSIYANGRTLTHEIGHWFGLIHTWGDDYCGDDYCNDTPTCSGSNDTRKCNNIYSNCNDIKTQNMIENYMDYSPDSCMNIFTKDQFTRARKVFNQNQRRNNVYQNAKYELADIDNLTVLVYENPNASPMKVGIYSLSPSNVSYMLYDMLGREVEANTYTNKRFYKIAWQKSTFSAGIYYLKVSDGKDVVTKKILIE